LKAGHKNCALKDQIKKLQQQISEYEQTIEMMEEEY